MAQWKESLNSVWEKGVVGAGGAGFPTHVKLNNQAEIFIVNAAECEPLLHKDKEILQHHTREFFEGLELARDIVGAKKTIIGMKKKYPAIIADLKSQAPSHCEVQPIGDFYPAGDEITLIYETTGRVVEPGKLPLTQNVIVNNVETLLNMARPHSVVTSFLTIGGFVENPCSLEVPVGTTYSEIIHFAKPMSDAFEILIGGPMMGKLEKNLNTPVTKATGGIIVLPNDHVLLKKYQVMASEALVRKIGKSACDQCNLCTELCPRYLLGHPIQPHKAMRTLMFSNDLPLSTTRQFSTHTLYCCECNLCSFFACPEDLFPSQVCILNKRELQAQKIPYEGPLDNTPHKMVEYRKTPVKNLMSRLDLLRFKNLGPLIPFESANKNFQVALKQHIGAPAKPLVNLGELVKKYQKIATCEGNLGSEIHSPADGVITQIDAAHIWVEKN